MFVNMFFYAPPQFCSHDLHTRPVRTSVPREQHQQPRAPELRLLLQADRGPERQPAGPPLGTVLAEHQLPGGHARGGLWSVLVPVHYCPRSCDPRLGPEEPLPTGWAPGLRLLHWTLYAELSRRGQRLGLFWQPSFGLVSFHARVPDSACVQLGFSLRVVLNQPRILDARGHLRAARTLFFHLWVRMYGRHASFGSTAFARAGILCCGSSSRLCVDLPLHGDGASTWSWWPQTAGWKLVAQVKEREWGQLCCVWRPCLLSALWGSHLWGLQRLFQGNRMWQVCGHLL